MSGRDAASERQVQAARPDQSTWLAANAGSGKTRVLTDRVARLLLAGTEPQNILCLTYTKAAASEMQNRLFKRLGEWAMMDSGRLARALEKLGAGGPITPEGMRHARTLFARAIEAPGGLKIQTIHSFCASLLRRFPLEAGVSPQFAEIEDRAGRLLQAGIVANMASGPQAHLVDAAARHVSDSDFASLTASILAQRDAFTGTADLPALLRLFGLPPGFDETALEAGVFEGGEAELIRDLIAALNTGGKTDQKNAAKLSAIAAFDLKALPVLEDVFLTGAGAKEPFSAKLGSFPTKAVQKANGALMPEVERLMLRVEAGRAQRLGLAAARKALALHGFASAFLPEYERRKQLRGWLDFDDQILKARRLLNDPSVAAWVLFRLDGGIDHILVDEAQDTSPEQWDVIEKLAQEFTVGEGARAGIERTIFVVGDKKQSIYSFQGADPRAFDEMRADFGGRLEAQGSQLLNLTLEYSFRSAPSLLRLVDLVFEGRAAAGFPQDAKHLAFKSDLPGRIELWPAVPKVDDNDNRHWTDPLDRPSPKHQNVILAGRIAKRIKAMISEGETIPDEQDHEFVRRPVRPGDFLILVQRRSDLFAEIIRACKSAGLPIAGADRLKVGAELAVKDLGALLKFLATPEDDLSLAVALKSPLFGWSEQALFTLAHHRGGAYLWEALRNGGDPGTLAVLNDLLGQTDFLRPFDLIERILTRHGGRRRLLSRLGSEAEDGINALLSQALAYERTDIPSLTGFLEWMETDDLEIKRQMGSAGNMVRVMTVHGAKGLESPIVILPDTAKRRVIDRGEIILADGTPVWRPPAADMPDALGPAREAARQREIDERQRLLYVALTRAEKHLIVAAAGDLDDGGDCWYQMVEEAMQRAGAPRQEYDGGEGLLLQDDAWTQLPLIPANEEPHSLPELPALYNQAAPAPPVLRETLSPSDLGGPKALPGEMGEDEEAAKLRGTRIHLLLEHLPLHHSAGWDGMARQLLADASGTEAATALEEASKVIGTPALAHIFAPEVLAEVAVTAEIGGQRFHGVIDRLIVSADSVLAVDFKTNATVPETPGACPDGLLRQMYVYGAALAQIYPDRRCQTAILWTRMAQLMLLPHDLVTAAGERIPHLDLPPRGS